MGFCIIRPETGFRFCTVSGQIQQSWQEQQGIKTQLFYALDSQHTPATGTLANTMSLHNASVKQLPPLNSTPLCDISIGVGIFTSVGVHSFDTLEFVVSPNSSNGPRRGQIFRPQFLVAGDNRCSIYPVIQKSQFLRLLRLHRP